MGDETGNPPPIASASLTYQGGTEWGKPLAAATTAAAAAGAFEVTSDVVFQGYTLEFQGTERFVIEELHTVLDSADLLVQSLVGLGLAGEFRILLTQLMELFELLREILDQWMMFNVHGAAPGG